MACTRPVLRGLALLACLAAAPAQERASVTYADLLANLTDLDWLFHPPPPGELGVQFSSYDRASDKGPGDAGAWYANRDAGHFLRVEERDGQREHVMVDTEGPGAVVRIWSANPKGLLRLYVDGAAEPTWEVDFKALTSGRDVVPEPLAGVRSRGANCYLPIPFQRRLKISSTDGGFYYHVNVRRFVPGTRVPSFTPELLQEAGDAIEATCRELAVARTPATGLRRFELPAGNQPTVRAALTLPADCVVRDLRVAVRSPETTDVDGANLLRGVLLVVRHGGEELVRAPVADFFGAAPDLKPYAGYAIGVTADGTGYCAFPMPMPKGGEIALVADDGAPRHFTLTADVQENAELPADTLLFRASWHERRGIPTRPFSDHRVLAAEGRGRFVGCALMVRNPVKGWWGEGDEKFYVDGEDFPSTFGTGTEDYFGYAWCSPQPFASAFHAQPQCDGPSNYGFTSVNRVQLADQVPFQSSFRFDLEVWHWTEGIGVDYASTAWWYGSAGARSGLPPVPPAAQRKLERLPVYAVHVVEGALEGEKLRVRSMTGGQQLIQDLGGFTSGKWSRESQLWWMDGKPGDQLVLALPVAAAGKYRVFAAFTKANDYAIVQLRLNDRALGEPVDLYSPGVAASGEIELGTVDLAAGDAQLGLEITGRNEKAKPRHMVGLDYVRLQRVER